MGANSGENLILGRKICIGKLLGRCYRNGIQLQTRHKTKKIEAFQSHDVYDTSCILEDLNFRQPSRLLKFQISKYFDFLTPKNLQKQSEIRRNYVKFFCKIFVPMFYFIFRKQHRSQQHKMAQKSKAAVQFEGRKLLSCSHGQQLGQQANWLLIG